MKKILFVDDEPFYCKQYFRKLKEHFNSEYSLHLIDRAEAGLQYILDNQDLALVILDVMMPSPPDVDRALTDDGKSTGIWLLRQIRETAVKRNVKVFLLSNRGIEDIKKEAEKIMYPNDLIQMGHKPQISARDLPNWIQAFLDRPLSRL